MVDLLSCYNIVRNSGKDPNSVSKFCANKFKTVVESARMDCFLDKVKITYQRIDSCVKRHKYEILNRINNWTMQLRTHKSEVED